MVIPPANTGKANNNKNTVICTVQTNKGSLSIGTPGILILNTVVIKFIASRIEDAPAKCKQKIAISSDPPECVCILAKGGYTVHPVPAPFLYKR